mgnify:CR=1 FL=1
MTTSFQCFKYMAVYSFIQTMTLVSLLSVGSSIGNPQFLYIDLFITLPLAITMAYTEAHEKLVDVRPTGSLVGSPVLTSLLGQLFIQLIFQVTTSYYYSYK